MKKITTTDVYGVTAYYKLYDKKLILLMEGYEFNVKPKNLFTRIFKRFIRYEIVVEKPELFSLIPKVKNLGLKKNWRTKK